MIDEQGVQAATMAWALQQLYRLETAVRELNVELAAQRSEIERLRTEARERATLQAEKRA